MSYSAKEKKRDMEDLLLPGEIWEGTVRSRAGREGGRAGRWQRRMLYNETPPTAPPAPRHRGEKTLPKEAVSCLNARVTGQGQFQEVEPK